MAEATAARTPTEEDATQRAMLQHVQLALYLAGVILAFMAIAPLFWMLSMSLKPSNEVFDTNLIPQRPTLSSFVHVFTQVDFARYLLNTFFVSATVTIVALILHSMAAYALARLRFPGRDTIFLAMFATFLISQPVIIVPLFILARALHMLDSYAGLIIPSIFNAFGIFLLRQFYLAIPRELEEAALIDGAGYFRIWLSIILPLSRPIMSALAILFFLANWNSFLWPLTITSNQDLWMVQVAIASFRQQYNGSWNYVMAASTVVALPTIVMFVIFQKRIIESIKTTGIK
ncbi:MAG: carbohydrate ABC transporter permease [Hyphomicrobiales bacterium]|nr:carbohydrate ABC transporter permease [Hyphomicrobiales bacterium]